MSGNTFNEVLKIKGTCGPFRGTELQVPIYPLSVFVGKSENPKSEILRILYYSRSFLRVLAEQLGNFETLNQAMSYIDRDLKLGKDSQIELEFDSKVNVLHKDSSGNFQLKENLMETLRSPFWRIDQMATAPQNLYLPSSRSFLFRLYMTSPSLFGDKKFPARYATFKNLLEYIRSYAQGDPANVKDQLSEIMKIFYDRFGGTMQYNLNFIPEKWKWSSAEGGKTSYPTDGLLSVWLIFAVADLLLHYKENYPDRKFYLYIEEPELHLHPEDQILVFRLLSELVKKGVWVAVSTNSPLLLKFLNNQIQLESLMASHVVVYEVGNNNMEKIISDSGWIDEDRLLTIDYEIEQEFNALRQTGEVI